MENSFQTFLLQISSSPIFVIDKDIDFKEYVQINFSESYLLENNIVLKSAIQFTNYIEFFLKNQQAKVAFGGYLEKRNLYDRSTSFFSLNEFNKRNIHLGIDLWCAEGTKVLAAFDAEIHSFHNNDSLGNYGPTIILKHFINEVEFYTLYGHLSLTSILNIKVGNVVKQREVIGTLGGASENGDYAAHLHFQVIKDIENYKGDYPGVCSESTLDFYKNNCPNPNLLLKLN